MTSLSISLSPEPLPTHPINREHTALVSVGIVLSLQEDPAWAQDQNTNDNRAEKIEKNLNL